MQSSTSCNTSMLRIALAMLLAALFTPSGAVLAQSEHGYPRLMQGPMVGAVTPTSVTLWMRASGPFPIEVEYATDPLLAEAERTGAVTAQKGEDYVVRHELTGLAPGTRYYYRVLVAGEEGRYVEGVQPFRVRTAPGEPARFTVAFGSCARFPERSTQAIWSHVERAAPDLFFWVGDNIYGDALDPDILAEEYRRQRTVTGLQPILRTTPQLATWDDHDYGLNDHDRRNPIKDEALALFVRYWANPAYGTDETPGVFFKYAYGGVDFFFLDDRYHRTPNAQPDGPEKTMLGAGQLAWLKAALRASRAPFKVLVSGSGWTRAKGPGGDSWASFVHERDVLLDFIQREGISGVVLLSGDTHVGELNAIPWSERGGYDFYDLVSSPLAQTPTSSWLDRRPEARIRPVFNGGPNFGRLTFDMTADDPTLRFNLVGEDGRAVWEPFVLRASELQNGVVSWTEKMDATSRRRYERWQQGRGYYQVEKP